MPLRALLNNETFWSKNLIDSDRDKPFKCPGCGESMLVVIPKLSHRIKHFRHKSGRMHGEQETEEHLQTKMWFKDNFDGAQLEYYMRNEDNIHVLDVLVPLKNGLNIGIECQYSGISIETVIERNTFYVENNIIPIWVFVKGKTFDPWKATDNELPMLFPQRIKRVERYILQKYSILFYFDGTDIFRARFCRVLGDILTKGWFETKQLSNIDFEMMLDKIHKIPIDKIKGAITRNLLKELNNEDYVSFYYNGVFDKEKLNTTLLKKYDSFQVATIMGKLLVQCDCGTWHKKQYLSCRPCYFKHREKIIDLERLKGPHEYWR